MSQHSFGAVAKLAEARRGEREAHDGGVDSRYKEDNTFFGVGS
jgi:hypothetical protein